MSIEALEVEMPTDVSQIPDIFISIYTEKNDLKSRFMGKQEERVGFARFSAKD